MSFMNGEKGYNVLYFPNLFIWPVPFEKLISKSHFGIHCFILTDKNKFDFVKIILTVSISPTAMLIWSACVIFKILSFKSNLGLLK